MSSDPLEVSDSLGAEASAPQMGRMVETLEGEEYIGEIFRKKWNDVSLEMEGVNFEESAFYDIDWFSAHMEWVRFNYARFLDCKFEEFSGGPVGFNNTQMIRVCFADSDLRSFVFEGVQLLGKEKGALLFGNEMESCNFNHSLFKNVLIKECNLQSANFKGARFIDCAFTQVDFSHTELQRASFENCEIKDCTWRETDLEDVQLDCQINNVRQLDAAKNKDPKNWEISKI